MQGHPAIGVRILGEPHSELIAMAREVARCHHERWDGHGYPLGLRGEEIPLSGRIVGLADVFDALVSRRCYKDPFPLDMAVDIVRSEEANHFDPDVVRAFMGCLDEVLALYQTGEA